MTLSELRREAERYHCTVVTNEFIDDIKRQSARLGRANDELRQVAALRLVLERRDWRGWLARRWVKRTERFLDLLQSASERPQEPL